MSETFPINAIASQCEIRAEEAIAFSVSQGNADALRIVFQNQPEKAAPTPSANPENDPRALVRVLKGGSRKADFGDESERYRRTGILSIQIQVLANTGKKVQGLIAADIIDYLEGKSFTGGGGTITFREADPADLGLDGKFDTLDISIPFWADSFKTA